MIKKEYILVTGGSGYIGSAICMQLLISNHAVIILDKKEPVGALAQFINSNAAYFFKSDFAHQVTLEYIFSHYTISAVIHCAASIEVGISVKDPAEFYTNNVSKTIILLDMMLKHRINKIIFSSSCAVFGIPTTQFLSEEHTKNPISPYGRTKLIVEMILYDYAQAYGLNAVILRYFNASGAWLEYDLGERHEPETHLIPCLLNALHSKKVFTLFGNTHTTPDGTCIRDYLHIKDIARAHEDAYLYLRSGHTGIQDFNIGTGVGTSIQEIINSVENLSKTSIEIKIDRARTGDPAFLVAHPDKAHTILTWKAQYSCIEHILETAYEFHKKISS